MKTDRVYLQHILDATLKTESYVSVGKEISMQESHWQDAVIRQLKIIPYFPGGGPLSCEMF